jgi:uncharacterized surface protein with fasciclin (FAS1) repeats
VLDVARQDPDLSVFVELVMKAGLDGIFDCAGPFTLLIPTNDGFANLNPADLAELLMKKHRKELIDILLYHMLPGVVLSNEFHDGKIEALNGDGLTVQANPLQFDDALVLDADNVACNGVYHKIDKVLIPGNDGKRF